MRAVLFLASLLLSAPAAAQPQTKVDLGDGVSVVFPSPPARSHMTYDPPPAGSTDATARMASAVASSDVWTVRLGGATFSANAMSQRLRPAVHVGPCSGPPMPVAPGTANPCDSPAKALADPPQLRRQLDNGTLVLTRTVHLNGHLYAVTYMRMGPDVVAKIDRNHETPPDSAGEAFVASFKVAARPAK